MLVAPAMNTIMWHQKVTHAHLHTLSDKGVTVVQPVAKRLACGDVGMGAMAEVDVIVERALALLTEHAEAEAAARAEGKPPFVL